MSTLFSKIAIGLGSLTLAGGAMAYSCSGVPQGVSLAATSGDVLIGSIGGDKLINTRFCSTLNESNNINVKACKDTYNMLLAAQLTDKQVEVFVTNGASCTTNTQWSFLSGFYYIILK